ncbi:MAG TPA: S-methyl-5-thioribose-1-phosphate isomerase [Solirubrobacteraceae bacterium]
MTQPLRFEDGALLLLDQTRLPGDEVWLRCTAPEEVAEAIARLAVRGAPAIGVAAAYGLALADQAGFEAAAERLAAARPTAVNLRWAIDQVRAAGPARALQTARAIEEREREATRRIAEHGAALFGAGEQVLTHCNTGALATTGSGTALGVIEEAWRHGAVAQVWVGETRPLNQGSRLTAWELEGAGIPFKVVTDSSAGLLMSRGLVDRVVVGADRIAANGDVANKIGTYPLAVLAHHHEIPFIVAAPTSTIDADTPTGADIPIEERNPSEVSPHGHPAANYAFDITPADLVTAVVTERGVTRGSDPHA